MNKRKQKVEYTSDEIFFAYLKDVCPVCDSTSIFELGETNSGGKTMAYNMGCRDCNCNYTIGFCRNPMHIDSEMTFYTLDIETSPTKPTDAPYALEPYRLPKGECFITSIAIHSRWRKAQWDYTQPVEGAIEILKSLDGREVYAHRASFDVSFLIASFGAELIRPFRWRDSVILNKWLINGQKAEAIHASYSLAECVRRAKLDDPELMEFLDIKKASVKAGEDFDYWLKRGRMDAKFTWLLVEKLLTYMTPEMTRGFIVVSNTIFPISQGYIKGIDIDVAKLAEYEAKTVARQKAILMELGIVGSVLTSAKQLGELLYGTWGLDVVERTPGGKPSTSAEAMLRLHQRYSSNDKLSLIMEYRKLATMMSKYVAGLHRAMDYNGEDKIYCCPNILSTITGRMTYSTKFFKKDCYQTSIALHQLPRKEKAIKQCMIAPAGYKVLYFDASAQEGRVMSMVASEQTMMEGYNNGLDLHSVLTETIFGTPYETIVKANKLGEGTVYEQRQAGKLTGLSSFYRIGAKALASKFFSTYGYDISIQTAQSYLSAFKKTYPGVVQYWSDAIKMAKSAGYAEAYGGFRFRINEWGWQGESSAINHKIQAGGAMLIYATIAIISKKYPMVILACQVHDSLTYFVPEDFNGDELIDYISNYNYGQLLGFDQTVQMKYEGFESNSFSH